MKINLNFNLKDFLLKKIGAERIFKYYYPGNFVLNKPCLSCFVDEKEPSMIIGQVNNSIIFKCFNSYHKGDCFTFVMNLFNLNFNDAIEKICVDFGLMNLNLEKFNATIRKIPLTISQPKNKDTKIKIIVKSFSTLDLKYWNDYYQDIDDLKRENIYVPKKIWINNKPMFFKKTDLIFCYYYPLINKWKIYRPFEEKTKKWLTNVPITTNWGLKNLNKEKNTLITKSLKDYMVCLKLYPHIIGIQNESLEAINKKDVPFIIENSKKVFYGGDSDKTGKSISYLITENYGFNHINTPDNLLPDIKDWAFWAKKEGIEKVNEHFKQKGLYD